MSQLPQVEARRLVRALKRLGFVEARQTGSHLILKRLHPPARAVVPMHHGRNLKRRTLQAIIDEAGISVNDLLAAL